MANPLTRPVSALGSLVELPAQLLDNLNRGAEALVEIRQQLGDVADLPRALERDVRETKEAILLTKAEIEATKAEIESMNEKMAVVIDIISRVQDRTDRVQSLFRRTTRDKDEEADSEPASEGAEA